MRNRNRVSGVTNNVFVDLGFDEFEAQELSLRSFFMSELQKAIRATQLTQAEVAKRLGIDQPRVSKLFNGQLSKFSTDKLIMYLLKFGFDIHVDLDPASKKRFGQVSFSAPVVKRRAISPKGRKTVA